MNYAPTPRTQVRRLKKRAAYDRTTVHAILDEGFICHVGFVVDGQPYVIPTVYARDKECLYLHGAMASRMLRTLSAGIAVCVTVTLVDGLVLARSAFHHSINYRSVVALGTARLVEDPQERMHALHRITDHVVPRRWAEVRGPNKLELKQTSVLALPLKEVSAKARSGPPVDDEEDYSLPIWAGVLPIETRLRKPLGDERLLPGARKPSLAKFTRFLAPKK
ncbi:MAG: pyridoxamine 5'-phosphate oxidase family protein [Steroidobacteraceae bacterium]|jgi:nitroimidazol reductase NimA-like FMN-containing flavoprotein (pyridoxamine 5'-phosphate oxidase superfamily)